MSTEENTDESTALRDACDEAHEAYLLALQVYRESDLSITRAKAAFETEMVGAHALRKECSEARRVYESARHAYIEALVVGSATDG